MQIIGSPASPFVQRCAIVARAKGHDIAFVPVPGGSLQSPEFQIVSPMGRIPILALDDGTHICESAAITAYFEETLEGPSLLPGNARERARAREIEAIAICELAAGLRPVMAHRVFRFSQNEPAVAGGVAQADRGCEALARLIGSTPLASGAALTMADAALVPFATLARNISEQPEVGALLDRHPFLLDYLDRAVANSAILARTVDEMTRAFAVVRARLAQPAPA